MHYAGSYFESTVLTSTPTNHSYKEKDLCLESIKPSLLFMSVCFKSYIQIHKVQGPGASKAAHIVGQTQQCEMSLLLVAY
jgi:hypothetical protein